MLTSITFDDISPARLPSSKLSWIAKLLNAIDVHGTFFIVPYGIVGRTCREEFVSSLKIALSLGHESALHGYRHVKNEFGLFYPVPVPAIPFPSFDEQEERMRLGLESLMKLTGSKPIGFRSPFYLYNNLTLRVLSSLGFRYDSSVTLFKPTHSISLRVRWSRKYGPYLTHGITEIPVRGDYTYDLNSANFIFSLRRALQDFEWVKSHKGAFVINFHPSRQSKNLLGEFIKTLVNRLRGKTEFVRLADMCVR